MKIVNLVNKGHSQIEYKTSKFPDGQQQVTILGEKGGNFNLKTDSYDDIIVPIRELDTSIKVRIKSRLNDFKDLELIICTVASLREIGYKSIELYVPYFLGSRSDRKFEEGSNNYLKTVICPIINSLKLDKVIVLDPHSDVLEACLDNFIKFDNSKVVKEALEYFKLEDFIIVSPDAGATKKIFKLTELLNINNKIITCSKDRDVNGKLTKTVVPISGLDVYSSKGYVIIDDICDGGATFINIAKEIKHIQDRCNQLRANRGKLYLIVTHGIFSKGFDELNKYFDGIYCTNSYSDIPDYYDNGMQKFKTNVKQLNVF